ncbi:2-oxo-tetronate isomerase [Paracoccus shanxieyensis]|uniref:TIM barrel protein n=1 Tax=Paracoccus shanxieyensis TaxID=2675752 RepID=A0A6L6IZZ0_9RHOB|nr:2-oxo-tetronate isomerase [Paracoccus shanxieyensis]MTH64144.1 TIM barrel protein [Paracoccus shanxieyensis]MTH87288.1 TIM barrel protein [Paracoccus shanxieyensis]
MPRFAANLSMMFTEYAFLDRFKAAADAGFRAVEYLFPYDHPAFEVADRLHAAGLEQALFNMPPGNWAAGERGLAALPGRQDEFRANVAVALDYARALGCPRLHAMAGITAGLDRATAEATYIDNIRFAADLLADAGITVLLEPINSRNMPGYFIAHQHQALDLIDRIDRPNVLVQLDLYHAQIMDGDLTTLIHAMQGRFGHVQIASVPDRHEPDEGELNYPHLYAVLDRLGYDGWIGCEYNPRGQTTAGLGWFAPYRTQA